MKKLTIAQVFTTFLKLGLTSFGGPVAHLGYFREEFVSRRKCLDENTYADLIALCQFMPGPASSQVGIGIGISQAGILGGVAAWTGFTLPSAFALILFAYGVTNLPATVIESGWLHGLKVAAVAVVAQAIWGMAQSLCPDAPRKLLAGVIAIITLVWSGVSGQVVGIIIGGIIGFFCLREESLSEQTLHLFKVGKKAAVISLAFFAALLIILPILVTGGSQVTSLVDSFYRSGSLVFGGGHVVLPLLQAEVVNPGWISKDLFLAGYGAAQAVPGPLFTFSAYLGAAMQAGPGGWLGGLLCLLAIFLPSFLLVVGILPFWNSLRQSNSVRRTLLGVNAAVVGLLIGAFINPVFTSGILSISDFIMAIIALAMLTRWKIPPWLVVSLTGLGGTLISFFN